MNMTLLDAISRVLENTGSSVTALVIIRAIVKAFKARDAGKLTPAQVDDEVARLLGSLADQDAAADAALKKKFG